MSRLQWILLGAVMLIGVALVTSALSAKAQGDRPLRGHEQAAVTGDPGSSDGTTASPQTNKGGHGHGQSAAAIAARADRQAQKAAAKGAKAAAKALRRSQAAGADPGATDGEDAEDGQDVDDDNQDGEDVEQEGDNDDEDEDEDDDNDNVQLPAAAADALLAAFPGAVIGEVDLDDEDGLELFEVELKQGDAEIDVKLAPDGTIVEIEQVVAIEAVPAAAATVIQDAAAGGTIKEIKMEEVRAQVQTVDGVPTPVLLDPPQVVYEAEIETGGQSGETKVAADGTVLEPLTLEGDDGEDGNVDNGDNGDADDNDDGGGTTAAGGVQGLKSGGASSGQGAGHGHGHQD
jgi:hypothetical protein